MEEKFYDFVIETVQKERGVNDLKTKRRYRPIVEAKMITVKILLEYGVSKTYIANILNLKQHATVINLENKFETAYKYNYDGVKESFDKCSDIVRKKFDNEISDDNVVNDIVMQIRDKLNMRKKYEFRRKVLSLLEPKRYGNGIT